MSVKLDKGFLGYALTFYAIAAACGFYAWWVFYKWELGPIALYPVYGVVLFGGFGTACVVDAFRYGGKS